VLRGAANPAPAGGAPPGLRQLLDVHESNGASVVAVREVPLEWVSRYGIVDGTPVSEAPRLRRLKQLVEKPSPEAAPSRLAIAGRYVFTPAIFDCIDATLAGVGGEIQLTDAMNRLAAREAVYALLWQARRYDIGNRLEYAKCFIDFALRRPDIGAELRAYVAQCLAPRGSGETGAG
jgi:UTP--glucose-1-phosphate uridylyltransferase